MQYDPASQTFSVERVLKNVDGRFFQCTDVASCEAAVDRALRLEPARPPDAALSDRLLQRLLDGGAQDIAFELVPRGEQLDVRVSYTAAAGTQAARETLVQPEWGGRPGREKYYLVIEAQPSMEPPRRYRTRKVASGPDGWREFWVLPQRKREVELVQRVSSAVEPLLAMSGLAAALELDSDGVVAVAPEPVEETEEPVAALPPPEPADPDDGVAVVEPEAAPAPVPEAVVEPRLESAPEPVPEPAPAPEPTPEPVPESAPVPVSEPEPVLEPAPEPEAAPVPEPAPPPAPIAPALEPAPEPEPEPAPEVAPKPVPAPAPVAAPEKPAPWPAPDPSSTARVYAYDLQLTGPMQLSLAIASSSHLLPRVEHCWQQHAEEGVQHSVLLGAVVRGDGFLASTSVTGEIGSGELRECLNRAVADWSFPAWGNAEESSDIVLPFVLRVEADTVRRRGRRKRRERVPG